MYYIDIYTFMLRTEKNKRTEIEQSRTLGIWALVVLIFST